MRYEITLAPEAVEDFKALSANLRSAAKDAMERHLRHRPLEETKSRIKRLRGLSHPQYRLRVGDIRIFSDINGGTVEILAIVPKSEAASWLRRVGELG